MRVFVTGATGFVGSAIVKELITAGHEVFGLARSNAAAATLATAGAVAHRGAIEDLESIRAAAAMAEGVIHTAFDNADFSKFAESSEVERLAIEAMGNVLAGSDRPLIVTAGFASLIRGHLATETDVRLPGTNPSPRVSEATAMALAERGVHASIVRLPCVHGNGDRFTVPMYIDIARKTGVSAFVGDGLNRWSAVNNIDAARLYCLALEKKAIGIRYHAVAEEGVRVRDVAEVIGRRLNVPVVSKAIHDADEHFGALSMFAQADISASSALTRKWLSWTPSGPRLLDDIDQPGYYDA